MGYTECLSVLVLSLCTQDSTRYKYLNESSNGYERRALEH